jgi:hypothetical protein
LEERGDRKAVGEGVYDRAKKSNFWPYVRKEVADAMMQALQIALGIG